MKPEIKDDFSLLETILDDSRYQSSLYNPGPYWYGKAKNAANEIKRCGLEDFRGSSSLIGLSFADNLYIDVRDSYNYGIMRRFAKYITKTFPLSRIFDAQVNWTKSYADQTIASSQEILNLKPKVKELLRRYRIPYSLLGGCKTSAEIDGRRYSFHYLDLLEQHDQVAAHIRFDAARSIFEIGGGFGINVHLLIENYPNIRKVIYLDIPPNLYVGTQYLKAFYGEAVSDYQRLRNLQEIKFSDKEDLEIFCIAPWQIERLQTDVDIFMNAHSFVEMPKDIVANYVHHFTRLPGAESSAIVLTTYDNFDLSTLDPKSLPKFFAGRDFRFFESECLMDSSRKNLYFLSVGNFEVQEIHQN